MENRSNESIMNAEKNAMEIDVARNRYPFCIVWTPIPLLTWMFPFIGHMGIAMSSGVIRDFAGPYFVSEDNMAFGNPTKMSRKRGTIWGGQRLLGSLIFGAWKSLNKRYWQLNPARVWSVSHSWDIAVSSASEEYKHRMHNLCCDNCHSHVAMALNLMEYDKANSWNMFKLTFLMLLKGKYVSFWGFLKTWLPFLLLGTGIVLLVILV